MGLLCMLGGYFLGRFRPNEGDRILAALDNGEFVPFMQPIVDLNNGVITGCEVLARWNKPDGSVVSPQEFIPLALNYQLTREVTCHIMEVTRDIFEDRGMRSRQSSRFLSIFSRGNWLMTKLWSDIRDIFKDARFGIENLIFRRYRTGCRSAT